MSTALTINQDNQQLDIRLPPARSNAVSELQQPDRIHRLFSRVHPSLDLVMKREVISAVINSANQLPKDVTPGSVQRAALNCCSLGLMPDTAHQYCHLVAMKRTVKSGGHERKERQCEVWIGYRGFLELAYASRYLAGATSEVILKGETARRWNDSKGAQIEHDIPFDRPDESRIRIGDIVAAYCIYETVDGFRDVELTGGKTLAGIASRGNVWESDPVAMAKKTPLRRAAKRWRISGERDNPLAAALQLEGEAEAGRGQSLLGDPIDEEHAAMDVDLAALTLDADQLPDEPTPEV